MKKGLTMLQSALIILGLICIISIGAADDYDMGRKLTIEGNGTFNIELRVNTGAHHSGIELHEDLSTPGGGFDGLSSAAYTSSFEVGMFNDNGNSTSVLEYRSSASVLNTKRSVYSANYVLGSVMGIKTRGYTEQDVNIYTDDLGMAAEFEGNVIGKLRIYNKMVNVTDHHTVIASDIIDLDGDFKYGWSGFAERVIHPADEVGGDWLGCP